MAGLIHIYCGDGKGKTTACVGLTVRAAGAGKKVVFTQFFKDGSSSEVKMLNQLPNIQTMHCKFHHGLFFRMNDEQKAKASEDYTKLFRDVVAAAQDADLLVMDELVSTCNHNTVSEQEVIEFLKNKPEKLEVVMTGRDPSEALCACADYITEMRKVKHPFDQGIPARKGIEF